MRGKTRGDGGSYVIHAREGTDAPFDRSILPHNVAGLTCRYLFFNIRAKCASEQILLFLWLVTTRSVTLISD